MERRYGATVQGFEEGDGYGPKDFQPPEWDNRWSRLVSYQEPQTWMSALAWDVTIHTNILVFATEATKCKHLQLKRNHKPTAPQRSCCL